MVELVDDDVVELVGIEAPKVAVQRLHTGEHHVTVGVAFLAGEERELATGPNLAVDVSGLLEDLVAVSDEQDPSKLRSCRVEGGEPGLAEAGGHDDEPGAVPVEPGCGERAQRFDLHAPRLDGLLGFRLQFRCDCRKVVRC